MIVVENKFTFLHIPKTAGMTLIKMFRKNFNVEMYGHHVPYKYQPMADYALPTVAIVRNPVDWYISAISFIKSRRNGYFVPRNKNNNRSGKNGSIISTVFDSEPTADDIVKLFLAPTAEQINTIKQFYNPRNIQFADSYGPKRIFFTDPTYWDDAQNYGLFNYHWNNLTEKVTGQSDITVIKYEELSTALPQFMSENLTGTVEQYTTMIENARKFHVTQNPVVLEQATIDLIIEKEANIINAYGY